MSAARRLAIVAAGALSSVACAPLGELPADQVATTTTTDDAGDVANPTTTSTPTTSTATTSTPTTGSEGEDTGADERWSQRCTNEVEGWVVQYPEDWHTNEGDVVGPCRLFDPDPIDLAFEASEVPPTIAVQLRAEDATRLEDVAADPTVEVVERRTLSVDGRPGERLEERHTGGGLLPGGTRSVRYVIDLGGEVLLASTFDLGDDDVTGNVAVLDELVRRLELVDPEPDAVRAALPEDTVAVFYTAEVADTCGSIRPVSRPARWPVVLGSAVEALLRGPTPGERQAGLSSPFSERTAGRLSSIAASNGVARVDFVDFSDVIAEPPSACDRQVLLGQLDATVTQFPEIDRAVYSFGGDVEAFYRWVGVPPPDR